jgi:NitT/TauT family transport system substrate-binding protein
MVARAIGLLVLLSALLASACAPASPRADVPAAAQPAAAQRATSAAPAPHAGGASPADSSRVTAQPLQPPQTVRIPNIGLSAQGPTYLALEQGYFRELGIEVELIPLNSSSEMVALLSSEQLDVGFMAISPAIFNAVARGVGIRMVADHGSTIPGRSTPSLAVRTDILERKPWSGYQDLRGMKVAIQQAGGTQSEYYLEQMLKRGGLQPGDIETVVMPYPDMAFAFANKAIDAAQYNEPWATQQEQAGIVKKLVYADDVDPNGHVAALIYSEPFARNTAAARNYTVAYVRGIRDYWDAYDGRLDFQIVVDVLKKHTPLKDEVLIRKVPPTGQNPAGHLDPAKLATIQDWFAERGQIPAKVEIEKALDQSFADHANAVLGPYQPVENPRRPG